MSSQRRKESSRANGAKSHGPITPEGKKRSSQNAIALEPEAFAQCIIAYGEPPAGLADLRQGYFDRFQPNDMAEHCLVDQMVAADWRISRVTTMETQALNKYLDRHHDGTNRYSYAFEAVAAAPATALLQRYEARLQLAYQRALRSLKLLRTIAPSRPENEPSPMTEQPEPAEPNPPPPTQPPDSEDVGGVCSSLPLSSLRASGAPAATPSPSQAPAKKPAMPEIPGILPLEGPNEPGGAILPS